MLLTSKLLTSKLPAGNIGWGWGTGRTITNSRVYDGEFLDVGILAITNEIKNAETFKGKRKSPRTFVLGP